MFLLCLIGLNAFFAASEIALISLNDNKLRIQAESGDKKAVLIQSLLGEPGKFLATIQIGITLAGFLASAYASESFADEAVAILGSLFSSVPQEWLKTISMVLITLILSYFTLVLGELVPKRLAMQKAEAISRITIVPLMILYRLTSPFVRLLTVSTNFFVRIAGVNPHDNDERITEEEIRMMVDVGEEKGAIHEAEKMMINNIFDFNNKSAENIMTHRTDICALPETANIKTAAELFRREKYSRIPIFRDSLDNITGILHIKDILIYLDDCKTSEEIFAKDIARKPVFVPAGKHIDKLFHEMQHSKSHMAVVVDEYGGTAGIITAEDMLEEIVGSITDEYDEEEECDITASGDNEFTAKGTIGLYALGDFISEEFSEEEFDTLGGLLASLTDKIPAAGDTARWRDYTLTVLTVRDKRADKILIKKILDK